MSATDTWKERQALRKQLEHVRAGDQVVVEIGGRNGTTVKMVAVERLTAKQLVADEMKFWRVGERAGERVGQASRSYRSSIRTARASVRVVKDEADSIAIHTQIAEQDTARQEASDAATKEHDAKMLRRKFRYEGKLDRWARHILAQVDEDLDEQLNAIAKHVGYGLDQCVRDLEYNEEAIRSSVSSAERQLEEIIDRLDNDMSIWLSSNDYLEKLAEREVIVKKSEDLLYLAKKLFGDHGHCRRCGADDVDLIDEVCAHFCEGVDDCNK